VLGFIVREIIRARWPDLLKKKPAKPKPAIVDWRPEAATARALLEEADRLAGAGRYAEAARNAICIFPDSEFKRALLWAPEFVVVREK